MISLSKKMYGHFQYPCSMQMFHLVLVFVMALLFFFFLFGKVIARNSLEFLFFPFCLENNRIY